MIALLGNDTDRSVAADLGISRASVGYKRRILGIPSYSDQQTGRARGHQWTPAEIALLGTASDPKVAEAVGLGVTTVATKRLALKIPPFVDLKPVDWSPEMEAPLGRLTDAEAAAVLGVSLGAVRGQRARRGIPGRQVIYRVLMTDELTRILGRPSTEVTRRTGLTARTVKCLREKLGIQALKVHHEWVAAEVKLLGTAPDPEVALKLGLTISQVRDKRFRDGIPAFHGQFRPWKAEELSLLRKGTDAQVAEWIGRSRSAVKQMRAKRGIPKLCL